MPLPSIDATISDKDVASFVGWTMMILRDEPPLVTRLEESLDHRAVFSVEPEGFPGTSAT